MIIVGNAARPVARPQERNPSAGGAFSLAVFVFLFIAASGSPVRSQNIETAERGDAASESADSRDFSEYIAMPETLMYKMRAGEAGFVVVDLRGADRFIAGHLRGAINYPWKSGVFLSAYKNLPMNGEVFLMSEDGGFGLEALRVLVDAGFAGAYSVEGGMRNWPYADLIEKP
jgi:rhodanese-related sulfurtransferase